VTPPVDITLLMDEIRRYLAAVDAFREEGCEPTWRPAGPVPSRRRRRRKTRIPA
jgi:hypothetical protein